MSPTNANDPTGFLQAPRDSLELGSLASSSASSPRHSQESSSPSGTPSSRRLSFADEDPLNIPNNESGGRAPNRIGRSYSVSSAFDFAPPLFHLSSTSNGYTSLSAPSTVERQDGGPLEKNKTLTYLNGLALVIGVIIGSGIFSSPSQVNRNAGSPGAALIVWLVAGLLTWTGASSYAELGGALPLNGGPQLYLTKIFGSPAGFQYSWCTVCILKPGSAAIVATIFGEYMVRAFIGADAIDASPFINKGVAILGAMLATLLNAISTKTAARSADIFMFFKFAALLAIAIIGVVVAATGFSWSGEASRDWRIHGWFEDTNTNTANLAVALYAGLWAYDGWDNVNYVTGELLQPSRNLPRIIHSAMPMVIVSYLLANTAYFIVLPLTVTSSSTTIAVAFGSQTFGKLGSLVFALTVCGSALGALSASTFTSSRLFYAAAKEGYLPSVFGVLGFFGRRVMTLPARTGSLSSKKTSRVQSFLASLCADEVTNSYFHTPIFALLLNLSITCFYIIVGNFATLVTFYGMAGYFFYFLTVLGLIILRVKEPHLERPYRCWITTPIIFCCVSLFLLSRSVVAQPWSTVAFAGFQAIGFVVYLWKVRKRSPADNNSRAMQNDSQDEKRWWRFWRKHLLY